MTAPLWQALLKHKTNAKGNFHVPGHKQGAFWSKTYGSEFSSILPFDLTEIGDLDNLHLPTGVIAKAQNLAAHTFGSSYTFFLVGGSTVGNLATLLTLCEPGDGVLIQRTSHQSIYHGCLISQVTPYLLPVNFHATYGYELALQPDKVEGILQQNPHIKLMVITSPSYEGILQPIAELAHICHAHNVILFVDEAHGAHFGFHEDLPSRALQLGAHVSVQSTHKMLPALTMSSMLHLGHALVERKDDFQRSLRILASSSPSYLLMASLDIARDYMHQNGRDIIDKSLYFIYILKQEIAKFSNIQQIIPSTKHDPFKILLFSKKIYDSFSLAKILEDHGFYVEKATHNYVLLILSLSFTQKDVDQLIVLLTKIDGICITSKKYLTQMQWCFESFALPVSLDVWRRKQAQKLSLDKAVGRISADFVIPYPPGIPVILPGETISQYMVTHLQKWLQSGGHVQGIIFDLNEPEIFICQS